MSLGNIFRTIAPIAAGAMFGPGGSALAAGTMGTSIAAGAVTGAGIAALAGDDPLMGAVRGGLGGFSGQGLGTALSGTAAPTTTTATNLPSGMLDASSLPKKAVGSSFTPTAGVNKGVSMTNISMPNTTPDSTFLSRLGGGSKLMGAGKLGAAGLPVIGAAAMPNYNEPNNPMAKYDPNRKLNLNMPTGIKNALMRDSGVRLLAQGGRAGVDYDSTRPSGGNMELMYKPFFGETGMDFFNIERGAERRTPGVDPLYPETDKMMIMRRQLDNEIGQLSEELRMQGPFLTDDSRRELETAIDAKIYARNIAEPTFERQMAEDKNTGRSKRIGEALEFYRPDFESDLNMAQGGYLETGMGDGVSDEIPASLDGEQDVMLSENEFVIPADVVSGLGNGSSDAGAEQLYAMMDRVRKARTGTEKMGKEVNAERLMPA